LLKYTHVPLIYKRNAHTPGSLTSHDQTTRLLYPLNWSCACGICDPSPFANLNSYTSDNRTDRPFIFYLLSRHMNSPRCLRSAANPIPVPRKGHLQRTVTRPKPHPRSLLNQTNPLRPPPYVKRHPNPIASSALPSTPQLPRQLSPKPALPSSMHKSHLPKGYKYGGHV
jgi:hypothetical protein